VALTLSALGTMERSEGNLDVATEHLQTGLSLARDGGWKGLVVSLASSLAVIAARLGDEAAVERYLSIATDADEGLELPFVSASLCCRRAIVAIWQGDSEAAARWTEAAEAHAERAGKRDSPKFASMLRAVEQARDKRHPTQD
jgi:hypothetical protein